MCTIDHVFNTKSQNHRELELGATISGLISLLKRARHFRSLMKMSFREISPAAPTSAPYESGALPIAVRRTLYPLEVVIQATPISHQAKGKSRGNWENTVRAAARERQIETYELGFVDDCVLAVTIYYFPSDPMEGDVDNIVKVILDGLAPIAYRDDKVVERVTVQKFEPEVDWEIPASSDQLARALDLDPPVVYIRVDDDLSWRSVR